VTATGERPVRRTAEHLADALTEARERSLGLLEPVPDRLLTRQHSSLMSPLAWDLGHVANYEELWLVRALTGETGARPDLDELYDAFRHPRNQRERLPILAPSAARAYAAGVRDRVVDLLGHLREDETNGPGATRARADGAASGSSATGPRAAADGAPCPDEIAALCASGFVHAMVVQHEHQHDETMLAALQLLAAPGYRPLAPRPPPAVAGAVTAAEVHLPGGCFTMGTSVDPWALDNERPAHQVGLAPYWLDTTPVTNASYASFIADGGYQDPRWWTAAGWSWRLEARLEHPQFWQRDGAGGWARDRFGWVETLVADEPVQHVCWYEADAYARWAGKRLPTEAEWEHAAATTPEGRTRRWPWGDDDPSPARAGLWYAAGTWGPGSSFGPAPVGARPGGASPWGVLGLIGEVWEWTASDFGGYPGFSPWPYREYSEVFFGSEYKVLRGGSWATHPSAMRATFRNWDYPIRRQIFAGFRCARDA